MGCGDFYVKYILFIILNVFFALAGLALLGLGVAVELKANVIDFLKENQLLQMVPISAVVLGGVVFFIAFFGCCGAVMASNCMLISYSIFMLVLMILKITMAVLIFVKWGSFVEEIPHQLQKAFETDEKGFHELERMLQCCGPSGYGSYFALVLPQSCCHPTARNCYITNANLRCDLAVESFFRANGTVVGEVAVVVVALELVVVVYAMCLAHHVRKRGNDSTILNTIQHFILGYIFPK